MPGRDFNSILAIGVVLSLCAHARAETPAPAQHDCLVTHVNEGRELNVQRRPLYSRWANRIGLSGVGSYSVSTILIASELFSIHDSKEIDRDAREFQDAGIPIVCDDLAPIPNSGPTPVCPDKGPCFIPGQVPLPAVEIPALVRARPQAEWSKRIRASYDQDLKIPRGTSFPATLETTRAILREVDQHPRFFCIGRHLLESLIRIAALAPRYEEARIQKGLEKSPLPISRRLIESHIRLLATTGETLGLKGLDTRAATFQSRGIPLICNDVPPIPDPDRP